MTNSIVLDASALLAYLLREKGAKRVKEALPAAAMSAVNFCEVLNRYAKDTNFESAKKLTKKIRTKLASLEAFTPEDAIDATAIHVSSRHLGLSLGDCICLAQGRKLNADVWTCDRNWAQLDASYRVMVIR